MSGAPDDTIPFTAPSETELLRAFAGLERVGSSPIAILRYLDGLAPNVLAYLLIHSRTMSASPAERGQKD